ncbi:hypothetical protein QQF64_011491 [Cirrhinus molitorella]|uniref:Uncharacterized protein n=1 Tax=Cirrhinus molitorella TaxID=172907 RepID=A0ABR3LZD1_9TELE
MLIPPHVLLALSKHGRSGTAPGRLSPRPPLQPTHGSAACSFTQQQTPGLLSRLSPASPCRLAVQHFQSNSNLRRKALY